MKRVTINLPERVYEELQRIADASSIPVEELTTDIVVDVVFAKRTAEVSPKNKVEKTPKDIHEGVDTWHGNQRQQTPVTRAFSVAEIFHDRDSTTIVQAQSFVDAALEYEGVNAFKNEDGIGFNPNFVFIERVYSREVGFSASYYGRPDEFRDYGIEMDPGRGDSYSRYKVKSPQDLQVALKALHISANLKSLNRRG